MTENRKRVNVEVAAQQRTAAVQTSVQTAGKAVAVEMHPVRNGSNAGLHGLEYESGSFIPAANNARPTISFLNAHESLPVCVMIVDAGSTVAPNSSVVIWAAVNWFSALSHAKVKIDTDTFNYGVRVYSYMNQNGVRAGGYSNMNTLTGTGTAVMSYYLSEDDFKPYCLSNTVYRTGRVYRWFAVWRQTV